VSPSDLARRVSRGKGGAGFHELFAPWTEALSTGWRPPIYVRPHLLDTTLATTLGGTEPVTRSCTVAAGDVVDPGALAAGTIGRMSIAWSQRPSFLST
jgi:hypothetical protein